MKILLYAHGGSKNHGCEAIVRSTKLLLTMADHITLLSYNPDEDLYYKLDNLVDIYREINPVKKSNIDFICAYIEQKLFKNYHRMDALQHKEAIEKLDDDYDYALFIGGDNYCYSDVKNYAYINQYVRNKVKKTVLWGCSVEPELCKDKTIKKDIEKYTFILARESISYKALKEINSNTYLLPDPAFFLPKEEVNIPEGFIPNETIGINLSPLIFKYGNECNILNSFKKLIDYILFNSKDQVALIPHVVWHHNNDQKVLCTLYEKYKDNDRVLLINDHNCMQQKFIISQCKRFVGARTHSTIAAYSTCVPTLVVGYSVKAKGIAKDLFGNIDNYVLPVQNIADSDQLTEKYKWLVEHEEEIKNKLLQKSLEMKELENEYNKLF
ncbi:polysaccharide pyruvyl transferase family protein [Catenibacterium mitsuokai]|uniref:polysaccharide pyruvyl transferase family protein n=1 Tax=Catenibacterium mitsuokai TaxID=100886 RepID=UPI00319E78A1